MFGSFVAKYAVFWRFDVEVEQEADSESILLQSAADLLRLSLIG